MNIQIDKRAEKTLSKNSRMIILGLLISALALLLLSVWASRVPIWPKWTGFQGKTFWDLLELLLIPLSLAGITILFNFQHTKTEREIAHDRRLEQVLQTYLERISDLLFKEELGNSDRDASIRGVARAWTLSTLRVLDGTRKGVILQFLNESGLIQGHSPVIDLGGGTGSGMVSIELGANLGQTVLRNGFLQQARLHCLDLSEADLSGAYLYGVSLYGSKLKRVNLGGARLVDCNMIGTDLSKANLADTNLMSDGLVAASNLTGVDLQGANLRGAKLGGIYKRATHVPGADLSGADLRGADLRGADLSGSFAALLGVDSSQKKNGAILFRAKLQRAKLDGADLRGTDLRSADLQGASLRGAQLAGIRYDANTRWPDGFAIPSTAINVDNAINDRE